MNFNTWLDTFIEEKELDPYHYFNVEGKEWGMNLIPLASVIEAAKAAPADVQAQLKRVLIRLDFINADVMGLFEQLAAEMAL